MLPVRRVKPEQILEIFAPGRRWLHASKSGSNRYIQMLDGSCGLLSLFSHAQQRASGLLELSWVFGWMCLQDFPKAELPSLRQPQHKESEHLVLDELKDRELFAAHQRKRRDSWMSLAAGSTPARLLQEKGEARCQCSRHLSLFSKRGRDTSKSALGDSTM